MHPILLLLTMAVVQVEHGAAMAEVSCRAMALSQAHEGGVQEKWSELQKQWDALRLRHEAVWLRRNRAGGLQDSTKRFVPFARFLANKSTSG